MADSATSPARLDSWKAIADYLQRDVATVRRWEKTLGLPIRRVSPGGGHSVFAFTNEIDAWLNRTPAPASVTAAPRSWRVWFAVAAGIGLAVALMSAIVAMRATPVAVSDIRLDVNTDGAWAFDSAGKLLWRYTESPDYRVTLPAGDQLWRVAGGRLPAVYLATSYRIRQLDGNVESGALRWLNQEGVLQRTFSFDDHVTINDKTFAPPWAITAFALDEKGGRRRIAVAAHHYVWNPSVVTVLDDEWKRRGTFVHDGWIEDVRWIAPNRLLISGFSNAQDGGTLAILDADPADGRDRAASLMPLRTVILPRSPINRATHSPFNRVILHVDSGRIIARTVEAPAAEGGVADAIYEFTPSLDLISASYGDRYRELRRALEANGVLTHGHTTTAADDGPPLIRVLDGTNGWTNVQAARRP